MLENIKAVLFDLDGTLYDNTGVGLQLVKSHFFRSFRMKKERSVRKSLKGKYFGSSEKFYDQFAMLLGGLKEGCDPAKKAPVMDWYYNFYLKSMNQVIFDRFPAHDGVADVVQCLRSGGIKVGVLSDYELSAEKLAGLGIDPGLFDCVASSAEFGGLKPCRQCFDGMAGRLGVDSVGVLVVGDRNDTDGEGARSAGMKFVQIRTEKACRKEAKGKKSGLIEGALYWEEFVSQVKGELQ